MKSDVEIKAKWLKGKIAHTASRLLWPSIKLSLTCLFPHFFARVLSDQWVYNMMTVLTAIFFSVFFFFSFCWDQQGLLSDDAQHLIGGPIRWCTTFQIVAFLNVFLEVSVSVFKCRISLPATHHCHQPLVLWVEVISVIHRSAPPFVLQPPRKCGFQVLLEQD